MITNLLTFGKTYIYELPVGNRFISFIQNNKVEDMGFYPNNL